MPLKFQLKTAVLPEQAAVQNRARQGEISTGLVEIDALCTAGLLWSYVQRGLENTRATREAARRELVKQDKRDGRTPGPRGRPRVASWSRGTLSLIHI